MVAKDGRTVRFPRTGETIRRHRERAKLDRYAVALAVGRCVTTVTRWERGHVEPRVSELAKLEALLPGLVAELFPAAP